LWQDLETVDLEDFRHNFVNITGLRLVDREDAVIRDTLQQMQLHQQHTGTILLNNSKQLIVKVGGPQRGGGGLPPPHTSPAAYPPTAATLTNDPLR